MLVDMIESGFGDRALLAHDGRAYDGADVAALARQGAAAVGDRRSVVYVGENHGLLPVALLGAAAAGVPFVPINYRLEDGQLRELIALHAGSLVLTDPATLERLDGVDGTTLDDWLAALPSCVPADAAFHDDGDVAVVLYTSGTTSTPKAAWLRHHHVMAYLLATVEFGGAAPRRGGSHRRAAVPRRRDREHALQSVRRPPSGVPHGVRRHALARGGTAGACDERNGRPDDAVTHRRSDR